MEVVSEDPFKVHFATHGDLTEMKPNKNLNFNGLAVKLCIGWSLNFFGSKAALAVAVYIFLHHT